MLDEKTIREELKAKTKEEIIDAIMWQYRVTKNALEYAKDEHWKKIFRNQMSEINEIINDIIYKEEGNSNETI